MPADEFLQYVLDQLAGPDGVAEVKARAMFGGFGLYCGQRFFACVWRGVLYFKVDDDTRPRYIDAGSEPFRPSARQTLSSYYEVPADVIENRSKLAAWARDAVAAAGRAAVKKRPAGRPRKGGNQPGRTRPK